MNNYSELTVVILTFNEAIHIERCIKSAFQVAGKVFVVDSFSTDRTVEIAKVSGAKVYQNNFINYSTQFAWALETLPIESEWVMRVDADEMISPSLAGEINSKLNNTAPDTNGFLVSLYVCFLGKIIHHGGYPQQQLRIWRHAKGRIEQRWMDEKILVDGGRIEKLRGVYIDYNLNGVTWWTEKHNKYATRECIDLLNKKYNFISVSFENSGRFFQDSQIKRYIKENVYVYLPIGFRAFLFFIYRYFFRLGFLDGRVGFVFHFLQGFWYRFLVDVKVWEVERRMRMEGISCSEAIQKEFGVNPVYASTNNP